MVRLRILDAAEELFAERGFFGTSVRDITEHARVRLAAINYHFGTKEELFRDVLLRRADALNADRRRRLNGTPASGSAALRVRAIVDSFVAPVLERATADSGFRSYFALVAQLASSRSWVLLLVADPFNALAREYVQALASVFPRASERSLNHGYQLLLAATLYSFSDNARLDSLTAGKLSSRDFPSLASSLVTFATAGICSSCGGSGARQSARSVEAGKRRRR